MQFLDLLKEQVIVLDGAMGTMIQELDVCDADFGGSDFRMLSDLLTLSRPYHIRDIHLAYYRAGAHAVETNSFGASPLRLGEYDFSGLQMAAFTAAGERADLQGMTSEALACHLSRRAAEVACEARDAYQTEARYDGRPLFVIGSIGPSNRVVSSTEASLGRATFDEISENFFHQVRGLLAGGADALLFETQQDILELKAAVMGARRAMDEAGRRVPVMAQVTVDQFGKMQIFNTDIQAALVTMTGTGIDTFGINCSIGPDLMRKTVEKLSKYSSLPISVIPNAGLPVSEAGRTVFKFTPADMAGYLKEFVVKDGVSIVGGCCGTTPDHIRAIAEAVKGAKPAARHTVEGVFLSGPQHAVSLDSSKGLIRVGERLNVRGSKKVRDAVESGGAIDHQALEEVVNEQVNDLGVEVIDVCMDSNVVDTAATLTEVVHKQTTDFSAAMSLDSFDHHALAAAIKAYPGRPLINSMSMEEVEPGVTKVEAVIRAVNAHFPVYVGLAAGAKGPGATADEKTDLARQIIDKAAEFGVDASRIFIDMNVFPLGSESVEGMNFALESLEAIPRIKALAPGVRTICGVGNLTNGLAQKPYMRQVLTSVWLAEGRKRGLDAAIVNPNHYVPVENLDPEHYQLGLRIVLEHDMEAFEELEHIAEEKRGIASKKTSNYDALPAEEAICRKIIDGHKEREAGSLELGARTYPYRDRIVLQAAEVLKTHEPLAFINSHLMAAMQELGDGFARGEVSLPHLLKSADVMKQVMGFFEEYMKAKSGVNLHDEIAYKGTIVLGTVYQDVHSIGKDLAKTLFENYGYRVIDLGVMTPLQQYLDTAKEYNADAIGMSALLVQTSNHMITVSQMAAEQGLGHLPLLVGGAPVNERHAAYVAMAGGDDPEQMRANVFYCPTAMDGVNVMNTLLGEEPDTLLDKNLLKLQDRLKRAEERAQKEEALMATLPRRTVSFAHHTLPAQPYVAPVHVAYRPTEFAPLIDRKTLFSLNWRFGGAKSRARRGESEAGLEKLLEEWLQRAENEGWLQPQGLYGIFPCYGEGDDVVVLDVETQRRELCRFDFNVVLGAGNEDIVSAAQFFRAKESGTLDAIGVQLTTGGPPIKEVLEKMKAEGDSEASLMLQGLSDRLAEDMADEVHRRQCLHIGRQNGSVGRRWSPGYPAMKNITNNRTIYQLLNAGERLPVQLTEAAEFYPTGTTAAVVSFHPDARYS
jgi:5-methyltetrahydrofolate--homocysteine methyltransferase